MRRICSVVLGKVLGGHFFVVEVFVDEEAGVFEEFGHFVLGIPGFHLFAGSGGQGLVGLGFFAVLDGRVVEADRGAFA